MKGRTDGSLKNPRRKRITATSGFNSKNSLVGYPPPDSGVALRPGDEIRIEAVADGGENAPIDYVEINPAAN
jgi:hypothetical protein